MNPETIKVLLIEDDEDDYILTRDLLADVKGTEYETVWISRYADALEAICKGDQDVCLVDYRLGEGTGIELLNEAAAAGCRVPMILLTGQADNDVDIEATNAGAADFLVKGKIDGQMLERSIRYSLAQARTLDNLRESESRFRSVVESANDAIFLLDSGGDILSWNRSAELIFGYQENEILHQPLSTLFPAAYVRNLAKDDTCDPLINSGLLMSPGAATELSGIRSDGTHFPMEISLSSWKTANAVFYSGIVRDITERKSLEGQLTHQALHDPLTKLANRVLFRDRVAHSLEKMSRGKGSVSVLFLDLDNFKTINDTLGHAAGDHLLISVAERLESCLRSGDTAARLGGDEFAVLVEDGKESEGPRLVAERILAIMKDPFVLAGNDSFIGASIGIATTTDAREKPEDLLRNADVAMYMAKGQGKGCYTIFETEMHEALMKTARLEADLRTGIYREEFEVYYQPMVNLISNRIIGMEALVRWNHPEQGLISPADFIPVAEQTSLILPLGRWILHEACRTTRHWQNMFEIGEELAVTVNISSRQFQDPDLLRTVEEALAMSGLSPESLILEITESTMLLNTDATIKKLSELKALGIRLAIDDFGTGYSSLSYLQRFPVDILKIDKSFIDKISHGDEGAALAKAIITMSDTLHLKTIAEGIETLGQQVELQGLGCEFGQGFHFAKPLRSVDMVDFIRSSLFDTHTSLPPVAPAKAGRELSLVG